ncbi:hypothetical protein D3C86_1846150 [compost metagenome]
MAAAQHMLAEPLRAAGIGYAGVEYGFHQRVLRTPVGQARAADDVADHEHVGAQADLVGVIAFDQLDAQGPQLVAHGGVDAGVTAGDAVTRFARQRGQSAHEGPANPQYMYVHGRGFYVWRGAAGGSPSARSQGLAKKSASGI